MTPLSRDAWSQLCADLARLREAGQISEARLDQLGEVAERLYNAGRISDVQVEQLTDALLSPEQLNTIEAIAYGLAKLLHTPLGELAAEARPHRASRAWLSPGEVREAIAFGATKLASTPIDQLAAEARMHRSRRGFRA